MWHYADSPLKVLRIIWMAHKIPFILCSSVSDLCGFLFLANGILCNFNLRLNNLFSVYKFFISLIYELLKPKLFLDIVKDWNQTGSALLTGFKKSNNNFNSIIAWNAKHYILTVGVKPDLITCVHPPITHIELKIWQTTVEY